MEEAVLTPADYFAILKRRKWSLVLPAVLIFLAAAAVAIGLPVLTGIPVIMTPKDIAARRRRRLATAAGVVLVIFTSVIVFHYQVMDLDVFWAKLMRKLAL